MASNRWVLWKQKEMWFHTSLGENGKRGSLYLAPKYSSYNLWDLVENKGYALGYGYLHYHLFLNQITCKMFLEINNIMVVTSTVYKIYALCTCWHIGWYYYTVLVVLLTLCLSSCNNNIEYIFKCCILWHWSKMCYKHTWSKLKL